jgi:thymidylate synthase ThyX
MQFVGLKAKLIWDGTDEVRIPPEMGAPKPGQMEGTVGERLTELCGRVCYDPATELLTESGWIRLDQLPKGVSVATYNAQTGRMEFQIPTEYIREPHEGPMYRVNTTKVSLFVTPAHHLYVRSGDPRSECGWGLRPAAEMEGTFYHVLRHARYEGGVAQPIVMRGHAYQQEVANARGRTGTVVTRKVDDVVIDIHQLPAWATLLGYYVSEGSLSMNEGTGSAPVVAIYQKTKNVAPIIEAAEACGLRPRIATTDPRNDVAQIRVGGSTLARYLVQFGKGSRNKRLPTYVFEWPAELREALLDALMAGDGTTTQHGIRVYNTNSKGLADDVQRLIISLGRPANINYSQCETCLMYRVRETAHREASVNKHKKQDKIVAYKGEVFCVSVPNRILVTRRDDKVVLCGNCYDSLGEGRLSGDYIQNILNVGHLSIAEHYTATVRIELDNLNDTRRFLATCLNRPWVWVNFESDYVLRLSTNIRGVREWDAWSHKLAEESTPGAYPLKYAEVVGLLLRDAFHPLAPRIVPQPDAATVWPTVSKAGIKSAKIVPPEHNSERWVSVYMVGSRGFSHEQVRHGDFTAISQRSTRYCEESESPWIVHPLIQAFLAAPDVNEQERASFQTELDLVRGCSQNLYRKLTNRLQEWIAPKLVNDKYAKTSSRKQARGAARGFLGNALETEVIFSASVLEWQHMIRMRCAGAADAEIRNLFVELIPLLKSTRYGSEFANYELEPASDTIGMALVGGGAK